MTQTHPSAKEIERAIRNIPDFPKAGIQFKDITPVLADARLFSGCVDLLIDGIKPGTVDAVVGIDARGFLFGAAVAYKLGVGCVPIRKKGKLPYKTIGSSYQLEYGDAEVEMHVDAIKPGWRVLVHDDLLATGGTASAAANLVKRVGGELAGFSFLINLDFLPGAKNLEGKFGLKPFYQVVY